MAALWFDCRKRPPPVGDHLILAFWVVAYRRFDCITYVAGNSKQDKIKRTPDLTLYRFLGTVQWYPATNGSTLTSDGSNSVNYMSLPI